MVTLGRLNYENRKICLYAIMCVHEYLIKNNVIIIQRDSTTFTSLSSLRPNKKNNKIANSFWRYMHPALHKVNSTKTKTFDIMAAGG